MGEKRPDDYDNKYTDKPDENDEEEQIDMEQLFRSLFETERLRRITVENYKKEIEELEKSGTEEDLLKIAFLKEELSIIDPPLDDEEEESSEEHDFIKSYLREKQLRKRNVIRRIRTVRVMTAITIIVIIIQIISMASVSSFDKSFFGSVYNWAKEIFVSSTDKNSDTSADDNIKEYNTIEEFIEKEKIKIVAPRYVPGNEEICKVEYHKLSPAAIHVFYNGDTFLTIKLDAPLSNLDKYNDMEEYSYNDTNYYISKELKTIIWEHDKSQYTFRDFFEIDDYKEIIKSIK